jgi:NAD(P)-dependent dehydrogenase (short-subunit alcohol dehydrogenase family)
VSRVSLDGKRVVVTGSCRGLGLAHAEQAAAAGATVVVNDRRMERATEVADAIVARGGRALPCAADVTDWGSSESLIDFCVAELGGIDGLVNNAGLQGRVSPLLEEDEADARALVEVNLLGTIFPSVHAARAMVDAGAGGSIVNTSSGNQCGAPLFATYSATKGAVSTLTYTWAMELAEHDIRVNALSPNAHTGMVDEIIAAVGHNPEERSYPTTADNAAVVVYLLSDESEAVNGQVVRVDYQSVSMNGHPVVLDGGVHLEEMTPDTIAQAFDDALGQQLQPLGISVAQMSHLGPVRH